MGNIIMRSFREKLEQEELDREFYFIFVLLYVFLLLLVLLSWINQLAENEIHYDREHENHAEWGFPFFMFLEF